MGAFFGPGLKAIIDAALSGNSGLTALHVSWNQSAPPTGEVDADGIGRTAIGTLRTEAAASGATANNTAAITSGAALAATAGLTHIGVLTAESGGVLIAGDELGSSVSLAIGERVRIQSSDLTLTFPVT